MQNLGLFCFSSNYNPSGHLQGTTVPDGVVHASNADVNKEETWFLCLVDAAAHTFLLCNYRSGCFLSRKGGGVDSHRVLADATNPGPMETWIMHKGDNYGKPGSVAFQCAGDIGTWLCTKSPGTNADGESGEVFVEFDNNVNSGPGWFGWWYMAGTGVPTDGPDFWNAAIGMVRGGTNIIIQGDIIAAKVFMT